VGAGAGFGRTTQRQEPAMPSRLPALEQLLSHARRLPIGAEPQPDGGVHFRVWAPRCREVAVEIEGLEPAVLQSEAEGYFSLSSLPARAGLRYRFRLDRGETALPDPASRFQPDGPHGPSEIVDPETFAWTDDAWLGVARERLVIYEMHIGTFTPEGSWEAASAELPALADLGVTCLEIMPIAEFPGRFGWGYDGVNLFAPTRLYGRPVDFRRFVDRAHALGIAVILDVVYNHFGPDGNYLKLFSAAYFTDRHDNDWGEAINFDGPESGPAREFFVANAGYWIDEYHLDGLRLDATQAIFDRSEDHILAAEAPLSLLRTSRSTPSWRAPSSGADTGSMRCGMTTSITARWWRLPDITRPTIPTIAVARASSSLPPSTASSIRGSATSGSGKRAARLRSTLQRNPLSSFCRTTTRSPIPAPENAVTR
jgi:1,4-alpha-glucan branching enzyme